MQTHENDGGMNRRRWIAVTAAALASVPGLGRAAPATPGLLLALEAPTGVDPAGYLVSEKLDGVRAWWDGRLLRSRSGRTIAAPETFLRGLPGVPLDGELWLGRGRFEAVSALARQTSPDATAWRSVAFHVFELPGAAGPFADRAARIEAVVAEARHPGLRAARQFRVDDRAALQRHLDAVVSAGGEGLMLHRADAPYLAGRQPVLLKLKPRQDDEAVVVAHLPGRGRLAGQVGALRVRRDDGLQFDVGSGLRDEERADPPPVGSRITYAYRGVTSNGVPRFATYLRRAEAV